MDRIMQDFSELEKSKNLFERTYCGFHYWQGIREVMGWSAISLGKMGVENAAESGKRRGISTLCGAFLEEIWNYLCLQRCDVLYCDHGPVLDRNIDGQMKDIYFDYFCYEDNYRIQRCYVNGRANRRKKPGIATDLILLDKMIYRIWGMLNKQKYIDLKEEGFISALCDEMNVRWGRNISSDTVIRMIRSYREIYQVYEKYYRRLLKKTHPKAIILQSHYSTVFYPLYKVAKEFSIPVIELQHGLINNHSAYYYLDISDKGKDLPDYLFTYGSFWETEIQLPIEMKPITVGNPFLEAMKEKYKNEVRDEKAIVFYSDQFDMSGKELEKIAVSLCKKCMDKGYKVYFKFHPLEKAVWKDQYKLLQNCKGMQMVESDMNVYRLFAMAKHHVFVMSTTMFEALNFDICRYVCSMQWVSETMREISLPLRERGVVQEFRSMQELEELISSKKEIKVNSVKEFWKSGAKENGQKALKEIISIYAGKRVL